MATRLYLSNFAAGYNPATTRGTWTYTDGSGNVKEMGGKVGSAATFVPTGKAAAGTWNQFSSKWVSPPLNADFLFSTAHTLSLVIGTKISSVTNAAGQWAIMAYVTTGDSDTPRGTILAQTTEAAADFSATATGRAGDAWALANLQAYAGDRIVIELGWQKTGTATSTRTHTHNYGNVGATDLTNGSANVTTEPGWFEFSPTIGFRRNISTPTETTTATELITIRTRTYVTISESTTAIDTPTVEAMVKEIFTTSTVWTCPAGVTSVRAKCWAGGGAGGGFPTGTSGGNGGGAGAYSEEGNIAVTAGNNYTVNVGAGAAGAKAPGADGGDSYFIDTSTVLAKGGEGGNSSSGGKGAGGLAASGVGDTRFDGGDGGNKYGSGIYSGSGGGGAGTTGNGGDAEDSAIGQIGAQGVGTALDGGTGGRGLSGSGNGNSGATRGGGGGGANGSALEGYTGGSGADGKVELLYYADPTGGSPSPNVSDATTATDVPTVSLSRYNVSVIESTTAVDVPTVVEPRLYLSVIDSTTATENRILYMPKLYISVSDFTFNIDDQSQLHTDNTSQSSSINFGVGVDDQYKAAQTFQPSATAYLSQIRVQLAKEGNPSDGVVIKIYSDGGTAPATLLATSLNTVSASVFAGAGEFLEVGFSFDPTVLLTANTTYWFVAERSGATNGTDNYEINGAQGSDTDYYSRGKDYLYDGTTWSNYDGYDGGWGYTFYYDLWFKEYYYQAESVTVNETSPININVSDSTTATDVPTVVEPKLYLSVSDSSTATDVPTILITRLYLSIIDSSTGVDVPTILIPYLYISIQESTTAVDSPTVLEPKLYLSVIDSTTATDSPTVLEPILYFSVIESTTATDVPTVVEPVLYLSVIDTTTAVDSPTVVEPKLYISTSDATTATDVPTVSNPRIYLNISDSTTAVDVPTFAANWAISVSDSTSPYDGQSESYNLSLYNDATHLYRFEGNSNDSKAADNGTDTNATYGTSYGVFNQGLHLTGTGKINFAAKLTPTSGAESISFRFKTTSANDDNTIFNNGGYTSSKTGIFFATYSSGKLLIMQGRSTGGTFNFTLFSNRTDLIDGSWHTAVFTWTGDTAANGVKLYIDGVLDSQTTALSSISAPTDNAQIGVFTDGVTDYGNYVGDLEDFTTYAKELSQLEITSITASTAIVSLISVSNVNINVSDSTTVADVLTIFETRYNISVIDSSTGTDVPTLIIPYEYISIVDSTTATELITIYQKLYNIIVSDSSTATDIPTVVEPKVYVSVFDSTTAVDIPTVLEPIQYISTFDSTTATELITIYQKSYNVAVSDSSTATESISLSYSRYNVSVFDSSTATERIVYFTGNESISVSDSSTLVDVPTILIPILKPSISDSTTAVDVVTIFITKWMVSVADSTTIVDVPRILIPILTVSILDSSTITENINVLIPYQYINVSDSSLVSDVPIVSAPTGITIYVSDSVVINDVPSFKISDLQIAVSDSTTITESISSYSVSFIYVQDSTTITEQIAACLAYSISVSDQTIVRDRLKVKRIRWYFQPATPSTWTKETQPVTAWSKETKPVTAWTKETQPTTSWTKVADPTTSWVKEEVQ